MDQYENFRFGPRVGFRVEVHDEQHRSRNSSFSGNSMTARDPLRDLDDDAFRDHLTWRPSAGPLISFFSNWERAMKWRRRFINEGAQSVVVIAVWLEGLEVYDAYDVASHLTGRPEVHLDEFLLHGTIWADSYRILAMFYGTRRLERVALSIPDCSFDAEIPGGFSQSMERTTIATSTLKDATEDFWNESYSLTGTEDGEKLNFLLWSIGGSSFPAMILLRER